MGGEGHFNSLFPDTPAVQETSRLVVGVTDSPKPPPRRITLTLPAVQRSREVWLVVSGEAKADAVAAAIGGAKPVDVPAAGAVGTRGDGVAARRGGGVQALAAELSPIAGFIHRLGLGCGLVSGLCVVSNVCSISLVRAALGSPAAARWGRGRGWRTPRVRAGCWRWLTNSSVSSAADGSEEREQWCLDNWDAVAASVAAAQNMSLGVAAHQLLIANALRHRLPRVAAVFAAGAISYRLSRRWCRAPG